jgi:hypothetical protein
MNVEQQIAERNGTVRRIVALDNAVVAALLGRRRLNVCKMKSWHRALVCAH